MILIIDNYDSFVYNLAQYVGELGREPLVYRNDQITLGEIEELAPTHIIISPGPGTPLDAGISPERASQIAVGDMILVKKGFLKGRRGIVNELDEKGGVKVTFGPLSSRLALTDVSGLGPASAAPKGSGTHQRRERGERGASKGRFRGKGSEKQSGSSQQSLESKQGKDAG